VGLKITGSSLEEVEAVGTRIEALLPAVRGTRGVYAERTGRGYFLDVEWDRDALARFGIDLGDAQMVLATAVGGENVTTAFDGRARHPVNVRYGRDFRSDLDALGRVLVPAGMGAATQVPLAQLAALRTASGPSMIRNENGLLTGHVYVDLAGRDPASYVAEAKVLLAAELAVPAGAAVQWSGQWEAQERVASRLATIVPLTLLVVLLLVHLNTRSWAKTAIVALAVPFSAVGAVGLLWLLGYDTSVATWVGLVALLGLDAETGVFMLLYLDLAYARAKGEGRMRGLADLDAAILDGAARRLRPKFMTFATTFVGLAPIMWSTGAGSDVMKRIAAPMVGGLLTSFVLELVVYPAIYRTWKWRAEVRHAAQAVAPAVAPDLPVRRAVASSLSR
jgi:Cu(I)/Ag(I) efflux system membrane protein CusA/SilA